LAVGGAVETRRAHLGDRFVGHAHVVTREIDGIVSTQIATPAGTTTSLRGAAMDTSRDHVRVGEAVAAHLGGGFEVIPEDHAGARAKPRHLLPDRGAHGERHPNSAAATIAVVPSPGSPARSGDVTVLAPNIVSVQHWDRLLGGLLYATSPRVDWASLLRRSFSVDVLECPKCRGRLRVVAVIPRESPGNPSWPTSACRPSLPPSHAHGTRPTNWTVTRRWRS
jgi:hypothetical protein